MQITRTALIHLVRSKHATYLVFPRQDSNPISAQGLYRRTSLLKTSPEGVISTSYENQQPVSKSFELSQDAGCLDNIGTTALRITRPLNCITNLGKMDQFINTRTSKLRCILDWWLQLSHSPVIFFIDNALKIPKFVLLSFTCVFTYP